MVKNGHLSIRAVPFDSRRHADLRVEVVDRRELIARLGREHFALSEQPLYHAFLLADSGQGVHTVDFVEVPVMPGRLLEIRPGQVQTWDIDSDFEASMVLAEPAMPSRALWFPGQGAYRDLDAEAIATAELLITSLRQQQARFAGDGASVRLMRALFEALVALFDQAAPPAETQPPDAYLAFRTAIEQDVVNGHLDSRSVAHYAARLGYSTRTLTRACRRATGQSAKGVLAERLTLEAKRLLAHTDQSVAAISTTIGISEPTNFGKFFKRHTGYTPGAFRRRTRR